MNIHQLKKEFIHNRDTFFLILLSSFFALLRIPSLIEPYWYGDEGIYQVIGMALRSGRLLYQGIWDNKPPILYLIYALFDGDQFYVRLFSLFFGIGSLVAFFFLSRKLFESKKAQYISTFIFATLFGTPLLEGNIANAENFMILPIIVAFYLILSFEKKRVLWKSILAGVLLSCALLTKIVALFDFAALLTILFTITYLDVPLLKKKGNLLKRIDIKKAIILLQEESALVISFLTPIILVALFFVIKGAFKDFYKAAFSQNVGYVGYGNYFLFPQGLLVLKLLLLLGAVLLILRWRKILGAAGSLIYIWLCFSLFNAFFSARPYTHYLLVLLPAFCFLFGYALDNYKLTKNIAKRLRMINGIVVILVLFLAFHSFSIYSKNIAYYKNYMDFVFGGKSVNDYQGFFDRNVSRDYELARFINANTKPEESVFLWSDSGQIYALSHKLPIGRYIVAYHITFYKDATAEIQNKMAISSPKYIIDTKHGNEVNQFLKNYTLRYKISDAKIYERM